MNQVRKLKKKTKTHRAPTPDEKFRETLGKLQRFTAKNQKLEIDLNDLKNRVTPAIQSVDENCVIASLDLALKLASMCDKKTLAEYHRQELFGWIMELRDAIAHNPFAGIVKLEKLDSAMEQALDKLHQNEDEKLKKKLKKQGYSDGQINEVFTQRKAEEPTQEDVENFFEEILAETAAEEALDEASLQDDLFGFTQDSKGDKSNEEFSNAFEDLFGAQDDFTSSHDEHIQFEKELDGLLSGKAIKTLFRRIAKVLHPDLSSCPEEKKAKHHKMAELLKARDEKNLPAILKQYSETVGEIPSDIFSGDIQKVTRVIEYAIEEQRDASFLLSKNNPELLFYYDMFYSSTKSKEHQKISTYKKQIAEKAKFFKGLNLELRNLKILKACLDERYRLHEAERFGFLE